MSNQISVSTKTGDKGTSGLANGERVPKDDLVFEVIGALDEVNSWLGLIAAKFDNQFHKQRKFLFEIQDTLFYIGAEVAKSPKAKLSEQSLKKLERKSAALQKSLSDDWTTKFLLPGGTELGGYLDLARAVCRRAERRLFAYGKQEKVRPIIGKYLNRLSDYLFVLRCFVNHAVEYDEQKFISKSD